mmetsp:Transcript_92255/g.261169  ORF Transcript_92255/g.261169 Transcript_92255/m.261169 type:complete len:370 (+) Transcript_92255:490-1599(+)
MRPPRGVAAAEHPDGHAKPPGELAAAGPQLCGPGELRQHPLQRHGEGDGVAHVREGEHEVALVLLALVPALARGAEQAPDAAPEHPQRRGGEAGAGGGEVLAAPREGEAQRDRRPRGRLVEARARLPQARGRREEAAAGAPRGAPAGAGPAREVVVGDGGGDELHDARRRGPPPGARLHEAVALDHVLAEVDDLRAPELREKAVDVREAGRGGEYLAPVARPLDGLGQRDRRAGVAPAPRHLVLRHRHWPARVDTHSDTKAFPRPVAARGGVGVVQCSSRPVAIKQLHLHLEAESDCVRRIVESELERVSFRSHFITLMLRKHLANGRVVQAQSLLHCFWVGFPQRRGALNIGKHHGESVRVARRCFLR